MIVSAPLLASLPRVTDGADMTAVSSPAPHADVKMLVEIADFSATGDASYNPEYILRITIVQDYALVAYRGNRRKAGGELLAHKSNGTWHVLYDAGNAMDVDDIEQYAPGIRPGIAKALFERDRAQRSTRRA